MRAVDEVERAERERHERQERQERERDERVRAAAAEQERRAHLRGGDAVAATRAVQHGVAEGAARCDKGCEHRWAGVCEGCRWRAAAVCPECIHAHGIASTGCKRCKREVQGACGGCVEAVRRMCNTCREAARQGDDGGQRRRRGDGGAATAAADREGAGAPGKRTRREPVAAPAGAPRGARARPPERGRQTPKQTVAALSDAARWRRRAVGGTDIEYVDFWEGDEHGWVVRFKIQSQGAVAGRGLFAARRFAAGENLAVYMGADLGGVGTAEGEGARAHLAAIHRADHIMQVGQQYVDGRSGCSGAQFINTDLHQSGRTNNARFAPT